MDLRVRFAGVPIGTVTMTLLSGLAHGVLAPAAGYELVRAQVESAGGQLTPKGLAARRYWPSARGDFADAVVSPVAGGYDLEDPRGIPVGAASVVVFAPPEREAVPLVVVDFRPQSAHVPALVTKT